MYLRMEHAFSQGRRFDLQGYKRRLYHRWERSGSFRIRWHTAGILRFQWGFESSTWHLNYEGIYTRLHEGAWTPERYAAGKEITAPALSNSQTSSDMRNNSYNWNDRAFLRLKNVEIAYTLPLNVSKKISADKIRFSLSGQNLVTWGRMKNKDIEPEYGGLYTIPAYRVYNVGVSVLF